MIVVFYLACISMLVRSITGAIRAASAFRASVLKLRRISLNTTILHYY